jgi:hypothetical protein
LLEVFILRKQLLGLAGFAIFAAALTGCTSSADTVSYNISRDAQEFRVFRKIIFINSITDTYIAEFEGFCSIEDQVNQVEVTCRVGENEYFKHFQGLSDNVTYTALQLEPGEVDRYHSKIILRPQTVAPNVEIDVK